jgi:hypothetical protein
MPAHGRPRNFFQYDPLSSAATAAPSKNLILPHKKSRNARCLQFAARLVVGVNVRALRETQTEVKCPTRRWILRRTARSLGLRFASNVSQAIEQASEFHAAAAIHRVIAA